MAKKEKKPPSYYELLQKHEAIKLLPKGTRLIDDDEFKELQRDSVRIIALDWDTLFDDGIRVFLQKLQFTKSEDKIVKKLFDSSIGGPLVSLTNKVRLAYALGLIDKTLESDLEQIHKIRNEFAHKVDIRFDNEAVIQLVKKLSTAKEQKVSANNSFTFYKAALKVCAKGIIEAIRKSSSRSKID